MYAVNCSKVCNLDSAKAKTKGLHEDKIRQVSVATKCGKQKAARARMSKPHDASSKCIGI